MKTATFAGALALVVSAATAHAQTPTWAVPAENTRCPSKWGAGDERGSANLMKPAVVLDAVKLIKTGEVIELAHVLGPAMPFELFSVMNTGRLGITIETLDAQLAEFFGVKDGVLVKSVAPDSSAAKAGLKAGDVITSINGRKVYEASDVTRAIDRTESNGDLTIDVTRDKKTQTLKGKLDARDTGARSRIRTIV